LLFTSVSFYGRTVVLERYIKLPHDHHRTKLNGPADALIFGTLQLQSSVTTRTPVSIEVQSGFEISAKFRRNSAKNFVFATYREKKIGIFRKISFENSKFKKIRPKFTEIRRNLPKFRNEISFPLNTGICNENEMVNPDPD